MAVLARSGQPLAIQVTTRNVSHHSLMSAERLARMEGQASDLAGFRNSYCRSWAKIQICWCLQSAIYGCSQEAEQALQHREARYDRSQGINATAPTNMSVVRGICAYRHTNDDDEP